jgi:hypothetical protein
MARGVGYEECIGFPSYDDPGNDPHVSEEGSPHARYAILNIDEQHVSGELIAVDFGTVG